MEDDWFERLQDWVAWFCILVTGVSLVVLTVIFGWLVYGRYVLNATPTWVEQVSLLLVVLITFIGAATGIRHNTHLSVDIFRKIMPKSIAWLFKVIVHLSVMVFGFVMAVQSYKLAAFKWSTMIPLIDVPEGLRAVPITVCGVLLVIYSLGHLRRLFKGQEDYQLPEGS